MKNALILLVAIACSKPAPKLFGDSPVGVARENVKRYAYEAYPSWSAVHTGKACPASLEELFAYMNTKDTNDPWGNPYVMICGDGKLPPGAKGIAVYSLGEDQKPETADDIKSWE